MSFSLLEAILWSPSEGFYLLEPHLRRLSASAGQFGVPLDLPDLRRMLDELAAGLPPRDHKVRIAAERDGAPRVTAQPLDEIPRPAVLRVCFADEPVSRAELTLYHKTSARDRFERELSRHPGFDDVILWNEEGEVTESCTANVVAELHGRRVTPPVRCGLLAGIFRAHLLAEGKLSEQVISRDELQSATSLWLVNSVRKWMPARLEEEPGRYRR